VGSDAVVSGSLKKKGAFVDTVVRKEDVSFHGLGEKGPGGACILTTEVGRKGKGSSSSWERVIFGEGPGGKGGEKTVDVEVEWEEREKKGGKRGLT